MERNFAEGDVLDFEFIKNKQEQKTNKKFSDKDIEYVKQYYNKYNGILSKQKILDKLLHLIKILKWVFKLIIKSLKESIK